MRRAVAAITLALVAASTTQGQAPANWPVYGGDLGSTKFSALTDITRENVGRLAPAWQWATGEAPMQQAGVRPGNFEVTPLVIDDTLYVSIVVQSRRGARCE